MDSDLDAGSTRQASSEPTLTAYHRGAADAGTAPTAPQSTLASGSPAWTPRSHFDPQSRDNLRQASVALDTAYERINSLRNSINNMLNRIPPEVAGTSPPTNGSTDTSDTQRRPSLGHDTSIRPPHSALVLSGEQAVEELNLRAARLRSLISPSARQRLEEFESGSGSTTSGDASARREFGWDRFSQGDRPPRLRTPPMPDLVLPRAREPVDPRAAQRRDLQSANRDDSSTMIGRRVAARVNASDTGSQGSLSSRLSLSQIEQRLQAQTAQVARELENMTERLAATRSRRVELASSRARGDSAPTGVEELNRPSQARSTTASSIARTVPNPPAGARPLRPARDVTLLDTTRIVLPQQISRTSSDGTPMEDLPAPPRHSTSLSAAYREHIATHRDHTQATNTNASQDSARNLANTPEVRGTLVNLLARERDERSSLAREHAQASVETNRRDDAPVRSDLSPPAGQGRRRRGWTRLNADGDEVDSDEDDNVSPHTRRLRMRFSYGTQGVDQPGVRSQTVTIEDILWRTSGSDSEADVQTPDATESCGPLFQSSPPRPAFLHPHPLPAPVEDMLVYPAAKPPQRPRVICVSKYASLAGR